MNIIAQIDQEIVDLQKRKASIQDKCSHPETNSTWHTTKNDYGLGDGGWYSYECLLCGKKYTIDSNQKKGT